MLKRCYCYICVNKMFVKLYTFYYVRKSKNGYRTLKIYVTSGCCK